MKKSILLAFLPVVLVLSSCSLVKTENNYFIEDNEYVRIYDYSLDDNYFSGYIELYNGERQGFKLYHVSSPNWGRYNYWGYDYYDYYYSNGNSLGMQKSKRAQSEAPKRVFRVSEK